MANCWSCTGDLGALRKVGREELCAACATWIHCCKNCRFWDGGARTCEESAAEWVHDRERANFCDFFVLPAPDDVGAAGPGPSAGAGDGRSRSAGGPPGGRDAFDRLFKR